MERRARFRFCRERQPLIPTEIVKFESLSNMIGAPVWQKSFYDHIIRDHRELQRIQKYIKHNPVRWAEDRNHPDNLRFGLQTAPIDG